MTDAEPQPYPRPPVAPGPTRADRADRADREAQVLEHPLGGLVDRGYPSSATASISNR